VRDPTPAGFRTPVDRRERTLVGPRDFALVKGRGRPFSSPGWIFELKYDGYRCFALRDGAARMISRQGAEMSRTFPELLDGLMLMPDGTAIDGEVVMLDDSGRPQFDRLFNRVAISHRSSVMRASRITPATLFAWDLLFLGGRDMRGLPLLTRKLALREALGDLPRVQYAGHIAGDGSRLYREAVSLEFEGIVAKRANSRYIAGITADWLKVTTPKGRENAALRARPTHRG
jgi:bifunctional non-homologous end joining protein LigD